MIDADFTVIRGESTIHFSVNDEGIILLSGMNGAGKTSSMLCLAGILLPVSGKIVVNGKDLSSVRSEKRGIVYINQNSFFSGMRVRNHLSLAPSTGISPEEIAAEFSLDWNARVSDLSQGYKIRVAVATAIVKKPSVILLDEVMSSISDPENFLRMLRNASETHSIDIVFVSQNQSFSELSDHHYRIEKGETRKIF